MTKRWYALINIRHRWLKWGVLSIFIFITGWVMLRVGVDRVSLESRDKEVVAKFMHRSEVRYFGYYSIKLPTDFVPTDGGMFIQGSDMTQVVTKKQYIAAFKQFIERYEEKLRHARVMDPKDEPFLKGKYIPPNQCECVIFERAVDSYTPDMARSLDGNGKMA